MKKAIGEDLNINFKVDNENEKAYVLGRDIPPFIIMLATAIYPGYEITYETKKEEK